VWLKSLYVERKKKRSGIGWEDGEPPLDYREMQKVEGGRIPKLKGERNLVRYVLAERIGIGRLNTHRERQGKEGVKCVCGKPRERGHYLECEKFDSESLVGLILKGSRGPLGL